MPFSKKQKSFVNNWLTTFPNTPVSFNNSICPNGKIGMISENGKGITVECIDNNPTILRLVDLLSDEECDHLINIADTRFSRSMAATDESNFHESRTSSSAFLTRSEDPVIKKIEERLARVLKIRPRQIEPLQVVKYQPGQKYDFHTDWFDESLPYEKTQVTEEMGGQREYTILIYLNDLEEEDLKTDNGSTCFKNANNGNGVCAKPKKGSGVFWKNVEHGKVTENTYHAGMPPRVSEKYAMNCWTRLGDFPF